MLFLAGEWACFDSLFLSTSADSHACRDHPALFARSMRLGNIAWSTRPRHGSLRAQIRHGTPDAACQVFAVPNSNATEVTFDRPEGAVAPGQVCALYEGDVCVGSGVIESVRTLEDEPNA